MTEKDAPVGMTEKDAPVGMTGRGCSGRDVVLGKVRRGEVGHWEDHQDVELAGAGVGEAVEDAGGDEDALARPKHEGFGSESYRGFASEEVENLFAGVGVFQHAIAGLEPLLAEIERGRAVGFIHEVL
jgi:hypothetical protein